MTFVIAAVVFVLLFILYNLFENKNLAVTDYLVEQKNVPCEFDGMRFVCLSDLHLNQFGKDDIKLIQTIKECNPDMILISGDMITSSRTKDAAIVISLFTRLAEEYLICYEPGNHELRWRYQGNQQEPTYEQYVQRMKELGIQFLDNTDFTIQKGNSSLQISGLNLPFQYYKKGRPIPLQCKTLDEILPPKDSDAYTILLAHVPDYFEQYATWGADVVLSGHNHGGIMRLGKLGGVISPRYQLFPRYDAGVFKKGSSVMFLSRGLGTHTIPLRIFNRPELICFQIKKKV